MTEHLHSLISTQNKFNHYLHDIGEILVIPQSLFSASSFQICTPKSPKLMLIFHDADTMEGISCGSGAGCKYKTINY